MALRWRELDVYGPPTYTACLGGIHAIVTLEEDGSVSYRVQLKTSKNRSVLADVSKVRGVDPFLRAEYLIKTYGRNLGVVKLKQELTNGVVEDTLPARDNHYRKLVMGLVLGGVYKHPEYEPCMVVAVANLRDGDQALAVFNDFMTGESFAFPVGVFKTLGYVLMESGDPLITKTKFDEPYSIKTYTEDNS